MSIQTDLTRITNAKAAIKTAIEGKGVTVPNGTLLDGMASLIESIEAGGGSGAKIATGTVTTNGALDGRYLLSPLDFEPTFAAIIRSEIPSTSCVLVGSITDCTQPVRFYVSYYSRSYMHSTVTNDGLHSVRTGFLLYVGNNLEYYNGKTDSFMDGTYTWVAIG